MNRVHLRIAARLLRALAWISLCVGILAATFPVAAVVIGQGFGDPSAPVVAVLAASIILALTLMWFAVLYGVAEATLILLNIDAKLAELENHVRPQRD